MPSRRQEYATQTVDDYHVRLTIPQILKLPPPDGGAPVKIGIVGAGIAGLYTALMLEWLRKNAEMKVKFTYDLLEANPDSTRIGGRIFTHRFSGETFDYYDVGAMRFPELPWMKSLFELMSHLDITEDNGLLIEYIMSTDNNHLFYNEKPLTRKKVEDAYQAHEFDPFNTHLSLSDRPGTLIDQQIGPFKTALATDWATGWKKLKNWDNFSTRTFMSAVDRWDPKDPDPSLPGPGPKPLLSQPIISFLETMDTATGLYDCALTETVLDSLDFDYPDIKMKWFCILGGASRIVRNAVARLSKDVRYGERVTAIAPSKRGENKSVNGVDVTIKRLHKGVEKTSVATYDHVISTIPLGCLNVVDTSQCGFNWNLRSAIRSLHYDSSVKVAIKFSKRWWELDYQQKGGVSATDRPTRTVVYPSYGINEPDAPGTIIVSYTWSQDASRMGAFVQGETGPPHMLDIILKDLADMHGVKDVIELQELVVDHHAWDWCSSEFSMGAFALFGPSQFTQLYPELTKPAFGKLHFAGEAASVHHAWIVGALSSAFRALCQVFMAYGCEDLIKRLKDPDSPFREAGKYELPEDRMGRQVAIGQDEAKHV